MRDLKRVEAEGSMLDLEETCRFTPFLLLSSTTARGPSLGLAERSTFVTRTPVHPATSILDLSREELEDLLAEWKEPRYRARQIRHALYMEGIQSFDEATALPKKLRHALGDAFIIDPLEAVLKLKSRERAVEKFLFRLADGELIETVLMRYEPTSSSRARRTACISTQAGCALDCTFCATGQQGFRRNLSTGEIVGQVTHVNRLLGATSARRDDPDRVTNVVFMGMGEPLANYKNTLRAVSTLNEGSGMNLGARHMTISTVGLAPQIVRLASEPYQVNLAVSLHAPNDEMRGRTMPVNRRYPIASLMSAVRRYISITNRRVSFEYVLLAGENDEPVHAEQLANLLTGMLCHVNLIPVNRTEAAYRRPDEGRIGVFRDILRRAGVPVTVRFEKGTDIQAGCGQLRERAISAQ